MISHIRKADFKIEYREKNNQFQKYRLKVTIPRELVDEESDIHVISLRNDRQDIQISRSTKKLLAEEIVQLEGPITDELGFVIVGLKSNLTLVGRVATRSRTLNFCLPFSNLCLLLSDKNWAGNDHALTNSIIVLPTIF